MDKIIMIILAAAPSCHVFCTQEDTLDNAGDTEDVEDEVEEEQPAAPAAKGRRKGWSSNAKPGEPRVKWTSKKDECLTEAWKTVGIDPITDAK
ncbi:putative methionyl-tRNA synthetase [Hordeum vulgare]|nr:putative methionyl-tRNA synthetase [Hordeum vulgare]